MNIQVPHRMNVDEFIAWALDRPGRYELVEGVVHQMSPQRIRHGEAKGDVYVALKAAIKRAGASCYAMPAGMTVRISERTAFEPDALIYPAPRLGPAVVEVRNPVVVVEVLSPSTRERDLGAKVAGYFSVPSIAHYLIVDADERLVIHHRRGIGGDVATEIVREGSLRLDPPGLDVPVAELFADED